MPYKKSEITKEAVYTAALELMVEKGFRGATIRDICKRANVSVGTFYSYYQNKRDIIREVYLPGDAFFLETVSHELEGKPTVEQLRLFFHYYARLNVETGLDILKVLYNPDNDAFRQAARPMHTILHDVIEQGQQTGQLRRMWPPQTIVDYLFDILRGICYDWCLCDAGFDLEERMLAMLDLILSGLLSEEEKK